MRRLSERLAALEAALGGGNFIHYGDYGLGERFVVDGADVDEATFRARLAAAGPAARLIKVEYVEDWRQDEAA
jgi:hypothetical protein